MNRLTTERARKCHVLLLYRALIPSVRLCGHCQMETLAEEGKVDYRARQVRQLQEEDVRWADVVMIGRLDDAFEYQLAKSLDEAGKYLIYLIDDDLLNLPEGVSSREYYAQPEIRQNILGMMAMSRTILSPSPRLLKRYAGERKGVLIEEPSLYPVGYAPHPDGAPVKIGFAGSIDRICDIERILSGAILRIKREYGDRVQFEFFGAIPSFAQDVGAATIAYCDSYDAYRRTLNALNWDIGLAPMPDTPFHACKHYNKFVEYAASGIVGIYSKLEPYTRAMERFGLGLFCDNTEEDWYRAMKRLVDDRDERERLRKAVCDCAATQTDQATSAHALYDALGEALAFRAPRMKKKRVHRADQPQNPFARAVSAVRRHGLRLPLVALKKVYHKARTALGRLLR